MATRVAIGAVHGTDSVAAAEQAGREHAALLRCGIDDLEASIRSSDLPPGFVDCSIQGQRDLLARLEERPADWEDVLGEASNTAHGARCRGTLPPISELGTRTLANGVPAYEEAVIAELQAIYEGGMNTATARCITATLLAELDPSELAAASINAGQLIAYLEGAFVPEQLALTVDQAAAQRIADGVITCAGALAARRLTLTDGNIDDALGRPETEVPRRDELVRCALTEIDLDLVTQQLAAQLTSGPDSWTADTGRDLIAASFTTVQHCADDLAIPRQEPKGP